MKINKGDYIAFGFAYTGGTPSEIIVDQVTDVSDGKYLVHFLYGHRSLSEWVKEDVIIGIGDKSANGKIRGWSGTYNIVQPEHPLLDY